MSFENKLRIELYTRNIQLKEFAGKINIPYSTLLSYLDGKNRLPKINIVVRMAKVLGVSVEYLIEDAEDEFNYTQKNTSLCPAFLEQMENLPFQIQKLLLDLVYELIKRY